MNNHAELTTILEKMTKIFQYCNSQECNECNHKQNCINTFLLTNQGIDHAFNLLPEEYRTVQTSPAEENKQAFAHELPKTKANPPMPPVRPPVSYERYTYRSKPKSAPAGETTENDPVNHPSHYTTGKIECIEFIEDKELGFHLGNALKYIVRAGKKDPAKTVQDLQKAVWYLNRKIEALTGEDSAT